MYSETRLHPCLAVRYTGMEWNGGSFKGVPVLPPPGACGKPVEVGTGLVYAVTGGRASHHSMGTAFRLVCACNSLEYLLGWKIEYRIMSTNCYPLRYLNGL